MEEETIVETLSDKSRSLRRTSVKKRLETEKKKKGSKVKEKVSKKRLLSKYRRKAANAKERERMKKMNDVFATLKSVIPADNKGDNEEEKETKVTTLRSAIAYINYLKQLIEDCDAGVIEKDEGAHKDVNDHSTKIAERFKSLKRTNVQKKTTKPVKSKVKGSKPIILDAKWTNYSPQFLENKFSVPKDLNLVERKDDKSYQNILLQPLPDITTFSNTSQYQINRYCSSPTETSCSSPRDVNEVSLHISLLEAQDCITQKDIGEDDIIVMGDDATVDMINENEDIYWQLQLNDLFNI